MTAALNLFEITEELVVFLRNSDVFTISQRSVTTQVDTGTFSAAASHTINHNNVKNIRSIVVAGNTLAFGTDYTVNYDSSSTCVITFTAAQTGAYTLTYDYGTDKIFPDFPRPDLTISSFPRIAVDILNITTEPGSFGNVNVSTITFTVVVYDPKSRVVKQTLSTIREKFIAAQTGFYYLKVVKPSFTGPLLPSPRDEGKDKVFQQNTDFESRFNYEIN
jgi:hypothetical protein